MSTFKCPTEPQEGIASADDIIGCGAEFAAAPDHEGFIDCPECGIAFKAPPRSTFYLTRSQRMTEITTVAVEAESEAAAIALAEMGVYRQVGDASYIDPEEAARFEVEAEVTPAEELETSPEWQEDLFDLWRYTMPKVQP